ncbi:unnamed protein product [Notodromas monacha]|uniref:SUZ RNA-binding domain-containing n=1 Tax=Notodromas monacha TaxID=399045 RepID=A0A7R9BI36_9CRUS|nr:unnamed protein product [Notodromas monacha]CAG0915619.1 unnamed protein product [Notodromas monacha]
MATVADSWEEMDDARRVEENLRKLNISARKMEPSQGSPVTVVVRDDCCRTQYRPDGPPQVRILKRTDDKSGSSGSSSQQRTHSSSKPNKSFQERQAEYQEARLRIMGRIEEPEPVMTTPPPPLLHTSQSSPALLPYPPLNGLVGPYPLPRANGELISVRDGARISVLRPGEMWPSSPLQPMVPLMRTPRGPDGSRGFRSCR